MKVGIVGHNGKMAKALFDAVSSDSSCVLAGYFGKNGGSFGSLQELFKNSDVIIDFTQPEITMACLKYVSGKTFICGTTGFNEKQIEAIKQASQNAKIFLSSNMSIGIAVLQHALKQITPLLPDFDIEILEKHHNKKIDSPSGTALSLGQNIAKIKNIDFKQNACFNRTEVNGERKANQIGFASIRGGTVAGEHTVYFFGNQETIELTHKAENRKIFATGAIRIAKIIHAKNSNGFFDMDSVISNLRS